MNLDRGDMTGFSDLEELTYKFGIRLRFLTNYAQFNFWFVSFFVSKYNIVLSFFIRGLVNQLLSKTFSQT